MPIKTKLSPLADLDKNANKKNCQLVDLDQNANKKENFHSW